MNPDILLRGDSAIVPGQTVLGSSSVYLNDPLLRDWIATEHLSRQGDADREVTAAWRLQLILAPLIDTNEIASLFADECHADPGLQAWFDERYVSQLTLADMAGLASQSLGDIYHRHMVAQGLDLEHFPLAPPKNDWEFYWLRRVQAHDFTHIVTGFGFDLLGEVGLILAGMTNCIRHFGAKLAGRLNMIPHFILTKTMTQVMLHHPEHWPALWAQVQAGARLGEASGSFLAERYDALLGKSLDEVREILGIKHVNMIDSAVASAAIRTAGSPAGKGE